MDSHRTKDDANFRRFAIETRNRLQEEFLKSAGVSTGPTLSLHFDYAGWEFGVTLPSGHQSKELPWYLANVVFACTLLDEDNDDGSTALLKVEVSTWLQTTTPGANPWVKDKKQWLFSDAFPLVNYEWDLTKALTHESARITFQQLGEYLASKLST